MDPSQQQEGYAAGGYGGYSAEQYYAGGFNQQGQGYGGQQAPDAASAYASYDQNAYQATYFGSGAQYGNGQESYDPAAATTTYLGTGTGYGQVDSGDAYAQSFAEYEREAKDRASSGGQGDRSGGRDFRSGGAGGGTGGGYRGGDRSGGRDYRGGDNRQSRFADHQKSSGGAGVADVETDQDTIYLTGLGEKITEEALIERFGSIGRIKFDKKKGGPKVWIYLDKATGKPKGDATITYEDPNAAAAAVQWFNDKEFQGSVVRVQLAEKKEPSGGSWGGGGGGFRGGRGGGRGGDFGGGRGDFGGGRGERPRDDFGGRPGGSFGGGEGRGAPPAAVPGAGRGAPPGRDGDWVCPGCSNTNFAKRTECNRCQAARPGGAPAAFDSRGGRGGGPPRDGGRGGFQAGVGDWSCPSCGNVNFARRSTCNRCSTAKPGATFGGDAGGPPRRPAAADYGKSDSRGGDYGRGGDDRRDRDSRDRDDDRASDRRRDDRSGGSRDPGGRQDSSRGDDRRSRRDDGARPY